MNERSCGARDREKQNALYVNVTRRASRESS